ncbi:hypothetical protein DW088_01970 [Butyricicoccus sp. AM05-1]|uniref:DNA cytosine methyltransferase n=1 Tax=Butyricicoccus sp. AM05-1 TaxID=2292004 RepID=UPI000E51460A|nr:hypothetical protein DW088_01970 [Butyricicoccus sp. AM05-1]
MGDITKINGREVPVVDCVIGGSPCQDVSIAGSKAGFGFRLFPCGLGVSAHADRIL